ncbi:MAG: class I SAM-dependent methyltransferase [Chloroflexi bacterium]|nr:class I SAM-dependent methyltransferase [Chloroflexota bacterium]
MTRASGGAERQASDAEQYIRMTEVFGPSYAALYDLLYESKDYEAECDLVERVFRDYAAAMPQRVLDLGCGTGGHAIPLALRGYDVVGVDRSPDMLRAAEQKARSARGAPLLVRFVPGDIRSVDLDGPFDACLCMFAVLCYQLGNEDVERTLRTARFHLSGGGLFVFDVWYGPAVLAQRPAPRVLSLEQGRRQVVRLATPALDPRSHSCETEYTLLVIEGDRVVQRSKERHRVRYFFPLELEYFLARTGFRLRRLGAFPAFDQEPSEATWNVMAVAEAL